MKLQNKMTVFTYKMGVQTIYYLLKESELIFTGVVNLISSV